MFGSELLDVAIGLAFVYALLSLVCSAVREAVEAWFKTRAVYLEDGIRQLLRDPYTKGGVEKSLTRALYDHPSVYGLYRGAYEPEAARNWFRRFFGSTDLPAYIPSSNFAVALLDIAARGKDVESKDEATPQSLAITPANIRARIDKLESPPVQRAILSAIDMAEGDLARAQANVEAWYDGAMDRVSGWYKRRTQLVLFLLGLGAAVLMNVNTITIARYLYHDEAARTAIVASAEAAGRDTTLKNAPLDSLLARMNDLDLPIGWRYGLAGVRPPRATTPAAAGSTGRQDSTGTRRDTTGTPRDTARAAPAAGGATPTTAGTQRDTARTPSDTARRATQAQSAGVGTDSATGMAGVAPRVLNPLSAVGAFLTTLWNRPGLAITALIGWLMTALAVSFGAPFWFDLLNKFMVIRSTVKPHEKSPPEGSEDRQPKVPGKIGGERGAGAGDGAGGTSGQDAAAQRRKDLKSQLPQRLPLKVPSTT